MQRYSIALSLLLFYFFYTGKYINNCRAANGDTLWVQAFTFGSQQDSVILFPPSVHRYEKILMYYTLKCVPGGAGGLQYPCGEWDYLTYTYVWDKSGERFEIARYITPYGIGLDLGPGFTWVFDVSDYAPLLYDSVRIKAGNWQEHLDLKFMMIEGVPPRDPLKVENIWSGDGDYGSSATIESLLVPKTFQLDPGARNTRLKVRVTGHGFGGTENCAEFCAKVHSFDVDGVTRFSRMVWRDDCGENPVYPQGGTWVYNRANWCPGAEVETYDFELTPYTTAGQSVILDYNVLGNYTWNGQGNKPYYKIESQLVSYGEPNFTLDAAVTEVLSPSPEDMKQRFNPVCSNASIKIKNTGSEPLEALLIEFGVEGGMSCYLRWNGNLAFLEEETVELPLFDWSGLDAGNPVFYAKVGEPNYGLDQYEHNNRISTQFNLPPQYDSLIVLWLQTNNFPWENAYALKDAAGKTLYSRDSSNLQPATFYADTFRLSPGCYVFEFTDYDEGLEGGDGLSWWVNNPPTTTNPPDIEGNGYVRLRSGIDNSLLKNFDPDFGNGVYHTFTVGYQLGAESTAADCSYNVGIEKDEIQSQLSVHPNPSPGIVTINMQMLESSDVQISVINMVGQEVYGLKLKGVKNEWFSIDLSVSPPGLYLILMDDGKAPHMEKIIIAR